MTLNTKPKRRSMLWPVLFAAAITAVLAGAAAIAYVIGWGLPTSATGQSAAAAPDVARQVECDSIKRAFTIWDGELFDLDALPEMKLMPDLAIDGAAEAGKKFLDEADGYPDQAAKDLTVKIAEYNVAIALLNLEFTTGGEYQQETYAKALTARQAVVTSYSVFTENTCN